MDANCTGKKATDPSTEQPKHHTSAAGRGTRCRNAADQRPAGRYAARRARSGKTGAAIPSLPRPGTRALDGLVKVASAAHAT
jgi:hypothetical protein